MPAAPAAVVVAAAPAPASTVEAAPVAAPVPTVAVPQAAAPVAIVVPPPQLTAASAPAQRPMRSLDGEVKEAKSLLTAGLVVFGVMYTITSLSGAIGIDTARTHRGTDPATGAKLEPDRRRVNFGRSMLIPVAGPFIAIPYGPKAMQRWGAAFAGATQLAGIVLTIVGTARLRRARMFERYQLGAGLARGGAMVGVSGRF
ncbi:MAG: hypothetical protein K1X88_04800 [Nannocystaceae bacterium]|nr:hypothetical protein [Nannocystaceae bacterium]